MSLLLAKLVLTPLLIAAVTLAARRWGPGVGGWLAGLPLTSGPVSVFLALEQGPVFAGRAAVGTLAGLIGVACFCVVYARFSRTHSWTLATAAGIAAYLAGAALLSRIPLALGPTVGGTVAVLLVAFRFLPISGAADRAPPQPRWDVPLRMAVATALVLLLTATAAALGPIVSGVLSPFPVFATVLAVFTHRHVGAAATQQLLRGIVLGSFAFAGFFVVVAAALERWEAAATYVVACASALIINVALRPFLASGRSR
jgi:hypothetical protein